MSDHLANETVIDAEREASPSDASTQSREAKKSREATERVVDAALQLGRLWARHGLTLGKLALETSATSLKTTAELLAAVSEAVAPEKPEPEPETTR
jgi:hypothetical protein